MAYPVSNEFKAALKKSHKTIQKAEVLRNGSPIQELDIIGGNVTADITRAVMRNCSVELALPDKITQNYMSYASEILSDDPVGYWRLGESSGTTAADFSGNGHDGTYYDSPSFGVVGALIEDTDTAVYFDGTTGARAQVSGIGDYHNGTGFTVEFWIKHKGTSGAHTGAYPYAAQDLGWPGWLIHGAGTGMLSLNFQARKSDTTYGGNVTVVAPENEWAHVVYTLSPDGTGKGYLNGVLEHARTVPVPESTPGKPRWGASSATNSLDCSLDEPAIYDRVLTAEDILRHYEAGLATMEERATRSHNDLTPEGITDVLSPGGNEIKLYRGVRMPQSGSYHGDVLQHEPAGYWRLGDSSGTVAEDRTGNGNPGEYAGAIVLGANGAVEGDTAVTFRRGTGTEPRVKWAAPEGFLPTGGDPYTIEAWVKSDVATAKAFVSYGGAGAFLRVWIYDDAVQVRTDTETTWLYFWGNVADGEWHQFALVFESGLLQLYVDGAHQDTGESRGIPLATSLDPHLVLGIAQGNDESYTDASRDQMWHGEIDEFAIYPYALGWRDLNSHYKKRDPHVDELAPLGVFRITDSKVEESDDGSVVLRVDGEDRAREVRRQKFHETMVIESGSEYDDALRHVLDPRLSSLYHKKIKYDGASNHWTLGRDIRWTPGRGIPDRIGHSKMTHTSGLNVDVPGAILSSNDTAINLRGAEGGQESYLRWSAAPASSTSFSWEFWISPDFHASAGYQRHIASVDGSDFITLNENGKIVFWVPGISAAGLVSNKVIPLATGNGSTEAWTHVVCVYDSEYAILYLDGIEDNRAYVGTGSALWNSDVQFGREWQLTTTETSYDGRFDEIAFYEFDLTQEVIKDHWNRGVLPGYAPFDFLITSEQTPLMYAETGDDPWEFSKKLAEAIGARLYFSVEGACTLDLQPDHSTAAVSWEFHEGENSTAVRMDKELIDAKTYNHVIIVGESTGLGAPIISERFDDDPQSPTYIFGPYGDVPYYKTEEILLSQAQADAMADALYRRFLGLTEQVTIESIPIPHLEPDDVISVKRGRMRIDHDYVIERIRMDLGPEATMVIDARSRRV